MLVAFRSLSIQDLRSHRARSALVCAAIALGCVAWTATCALQLALDVAFRSASAPAVRADLIVTRGDGRFDEAMIELVRQTPGVKAARPQLVERGRVLGPHSAPVTLVGVDRSDAESTGITVSAADQVAFVKSWLRGRLPVFATPDLVAIFGGKLGSFEATFAGKRRVIDVVGAIPIRSRGAELPRGLLLTDRHLAAWALNRTSASSRIDVDLAEGTSADRVKARLEQALVGRADVTTPESDAARALDSIAAIRVGFSLCGVGGLFLAYFLIANVMRVSVAQREATIGLVRAIGGTRAQVMALVQGEAVLLGAVGSAVGVTFGYLVARLAINPLIDVVGDVFRSVPASDLHIEPGVVLLGAAAGIGTSVAATLAPSLHASSIPPIRAMRNAALATGHGRRTRFAGAITLLMVTIVCASLIPIWPSVAIYATLGASTLTSTVVLRSLIRPLAGALRPLVERMAGMPGRFAMDSIIATPARAGAAVAGLAAAVALLIQTGGVIQSNEQAVRAWVDGCITGDLFVTSGGPLSASGRTMPMDPSLGEAIARSMARATVVPMRFRRVPWRDRTHASEIVVVALDAARYVRMAERRVPPLRDLDLYRELQRPSAALISDNFAERNGLRIGSTFRLPGIDGVRVRLRVAGIVADYSSHCGTVLVDQGGAGGRLANAPVDLFVVGLDSPTEVARARCALASADWASEACAEIMTHEEVRGHILGTIRRLHRVAKLQEALAAAVAVLGVSAALMICVMQRRHELALLRAIGASVSQVVATVLIEAMVMAGIGAAVGIALGLAAEWYVLRVVLFFETGFRFPLTIPWWDAVSISSVVIVSAAIAALAPAWSAARADERSALGADG